MDAQHWLDWGKRGTLVDWLIEVHAKSEFLPETLYLAIHILDRFLTVKTISYQKLQLAGITAMFIAVKYQEVPSPNTAHFKYFATSTMEDIFRAEQYMLRTLDYLS